MKRWFRNLISILLVLVLSISYLPAGVQAEEGVIPLTFTGVSVGYTNASSLGLTTNVDFGDYGITAGWTPLGFPQLHVGNAGGTTDVTTALYNPEGSILYFEGAFSGVIDATSVTIAKGTKYTFGGHTFEVTDDFEVRNEGNGWVVYEAPEVDEDGNYLVSIEDIVGIHVYPNLDYLVEMYFTTNQNWSAANTTASGQAVYVGNMAHKVNGVAVQNNGQLLINHYAGASMAEGSIVKIPVGTTFQAGDITYKLKETFAFTYNGATSGTKIDTIPLTFTGILASETNASNLALTTDVDFYTNYGWDSFGKQFVEDAKIKLNDVATDAIIWCLYGQHIFLEGFFANASNPTNVKIAKGTCLTREGYMFEVTEDFEIVNDGNGWTVYEDSVVTPEPDPEPVENTKVTITGIGSINRVTDLEKPLYGLTEMYFTTDQTWSKATTTSSGQKIKVHNSYHNVDSIHILDNGALLFNHWAGAHMSDGTIVKVPAGTLFEAAGITYEIAEDFAFIYNGEASGTKVEPIPLTFNGVHVAHTNDTNLALTTNIHFHNVYGWDTWTFGVNMPMDTSLMVNDAAQTMATPCYLEATTIYFQNAFHGVTEPTNVKIAKGTWFTCDGKVFEVTEDFELQYNSEKEKWIWTGAEPEPDISENVTIKGIYFQNGNDMYLTTDLAADHAFVGKKFTTSDVVVTKADGTSANVSNFSIHVADGISTIAYGYEAAEGDVITFKKNGTAFNEAEAYEIRFANAFAMKYNGSKWEVCQEQTSVDGILVQAGTELYLKTSLSDTHYFAGNKFSSSDVVVIGSDGATTEVSFSLHSSDGLSNMYINYSPKTGDVLTVKKGGTAVSDSTGYSIKFTNGYALQYNGTKWVSYVQNVKITGIEVQATGVVYLKTNLGANHILYAGNKAYTSADIAITKNDGSAGIIDYMTVDANTGAICVGYAAEEGDVLFVKKDGTASNATYGYTMKFENAYVLKYNGTKWVANYTDVTFNEKLVQSDSAVYELYMELDIDETSEVYNLGTLTSSDITVTKKNGAIGTIAQVKISENHLAVVWYDGDIAEGDILSIKAGGIATSEANKSGVRFVNKMTLYFEDGAWHLDNDAPEFYYEDKIVTSTTTITAKVGRSKASLENMFYAKDRIKGAVDIAFAYSEGALDTNNILCEGTWNLTLAADDGHGNPIRQTVTLIVESKTILGDSDYNDVLSVSDLVRMKKAIANGATDLTLYDMNADGNVNTTDADYMRKVLLGVYSVVDNQTVLLPNYEGSAVLFADCPPSQLSNEAVQEYFEAGFTHMQMTEDYTALTAEKQTPFEPYKNAIERIQKYGAVMVRNQYGDVDYFVNEAEKEVLWGGNLIGKIPVRNLTTEFADMGVAAFYYDDEPSVTEIAQMDKIVEWHNTYNKGAMFHVNLLPSYGSVEAFGGTFKNYIQSYVDNVLAKVDGKKTLSIDNYPLRYESGNKFIRYSYLSDFLVVAQAVKDFNASNASSPAEVSFCIQSYGVDSGTKGNRQIESLADITFQTNMAIAMGARNLEYYMYRGEHSMIENEEKTDVYEYVKTANKQVQAWDHVFTSFDWQGTKMFGDTTSALYRSASNQFVSTFAKATATADKATVVSEFKDAYGNYAYMAVNATEPSAGESTNVALTFAGANKVVAYKNGVANVVNIVDGIYNTTLAAGEGVFCIPIYE